MGLAFIAAEMGMNCILALSLAPAVMLSGTCLVRNAIELAKLDSAFAGWTGLFSD